MMRSPPASGSIATGAMSRTRRVPRSELSATAMMIATAAIAGHGYGRRSIPPMIEAVAGVAFPL